MTKSAAAVEPTAFTLPTLTCTRCGHQWIQRTAVPKFCPNCHSLYWNRPRQAKAPATAPARKGR